MLSSKVPSLPFISICAYVMGGVFLGMGFTVNPSLFIGFGIMMLVVWLEQRNNKRVAAKDLSARTKELVGKIVRTTSFSPNSDDILFEIETSESAKRIFVHCERHCVRMSMKNLVFGRKVRVVFLAYDSRGGQRRVIGSSNVLDVWEYQEGVFLGRPNPGHEAMKRAFELP